MYYDSVKNAVNDQNIVYVNLSGDLEAMATNIVNAMEETGVKRIIAISSIGIYDMPLRPVLIPYRKLADIIENAGLEYTILRPNWFTDADEIDFSITQKGSRKTEGLSLEKVSQLLLLLLSKIHLFTITKIWYQQTSIIPNTDGDVSAMTFEL